MYFVGHNGKMVNGNVISVGSGSKIALGVAESGLKHDLTDEEAFELGRRAIYQATLNDNTSSGGIIQGIFACTHFFFKFILT